MLVKIEIYFDGEFWCARGIGENIFTQGNTLEDLYQNIKEAISVHYSEIDEPTSILTLKLAFTSTGLGYPLLRHICLSG